MHHKKQFTTPSASDDGLKRADGLLRLHHPELFISSRRLRQVETIRMVHEKREENVQNLGFSSRPFVLCGLPVKRPPKGCLLHERRNGRFLLQVTGHPSYGLPYGQDRLVPIFLSTMAVRQKSSRITFDSAAEMLDTFGMQQDLMSDRTNQRIWPVTLRHIDAIVSTYLGPGRVPGNRQAECFSRQVSMYLAKHVGGLSTPEIGRFYNGRHHTTVLYSIQKMQRLREADEAVAALVDELIEALVPSVGYTPPEPSRSKGRSSVMDAVASLVIDRLGSSAVISSDLRSPATRKRLLREPAEELPSVSPLELLAGWIAQPPGHIRK